MKQLNEKPSKFKNIGQDVLGAARHRFDTYTDKEKRVIQKKKESDKNLKDLKKKYSSMILSRDLLREYECLKVGLKNEYLKIESTNPIGSKIWLQELKLKVLEKRTSENCKDFNRLSRLCQKISSPYYFSDSQVENYFKKKDVSSFTENNGVTTLWNDENLVENDIKELFINIQGVQWGNSVPDSEREFCLNKLNESISILNTKLSIDFSNLTIAFAARGRKGAAAHYEESKKIINISRHNEGSLLHEIGHFFDYTQTIHPRYSIPQNVFEKYKAQILNDETLKQNRDYYLKKEEIFARFFEVFVYHEVFENKLPSFLVNINRAALPSLDDESISWMKNCLKEILK